MVKDWEGWEWRRTEKAGNGEGLGGLGMVKD